tara:strand:- start:509 stop:868 length:360 start_codon:yes stop_codon:yes gene_type:complete
VQVYDTIKLLEDGCTTSDLYKVIEPPLEHAEISSLVSQLVLAKNAPVRSDRPGSTGAHFGLRVVGPLPDQLVRDETIPKRSYTKVAKEMDIRALTEVELLRLKIAVNKRLEEVRRGADV